jgi:DNA-binding transcriptional regulator LsrR (DeoR family)
MYYTEGLTQSVIAEKLNLSQASVSRLMKRAHDERIIRIAVDVPRGIYPELEDGLITQYGLSEAIVVDCVADDEAQILVSLGEAAAFFLETTLSEGDVIGVSSWSQSILQMVDRIHPMKRVSAACVVQTLGGMGDPGMEFHATQLTTRLARLTQAEPVLLPAPGVASSTATREILLEDRFVQAAMTEFGKITLAMLGIGTVQPSELLARSGNVFTGEELEELRRLGAVGDLSLRFFDADGAPVHTALDGRVIGISLPEIKAVPRVAGVAGGARKVAAIRGAMRGGYLDVLITDRFTATKLIADA